MSSSASYDHAMMSSMGTPASKASMISTMPILRPTSVISSLALPSSSSACEIPRNSPLSPSAASQSFTIEDVVGKHTVSVMFKDVQVWMAETGSNGLTIFTIVMTVLVLVIGVCASVYSIRKRNGKAGSWQLR